MRTDLQRFSVPVLIFDGVNHNVPAIDYIAYCDFTDEELETLVPAAEQYSRNEDGSVKTLGEYAAMGFGNIRRLAPIHGNIYRINVFSEDSLAIWDRYLAPIGKGAGTWMTQDEAIAASGVNDGIY